MCQQFIRCHCKSFLLPVCAWTLQRPGIIIIVRLEKQKCSLLKDIYVKKKTPSLNLNKKVEGVTGPQNQEYGLEA
jgi:hypothetical protein